MLIASVLSHERHNWVFLTPTKKPNFSKAMDMEQSELNYMIVPN